jgi:transposase
MGSRGWEDDEEPRILTARREQLRWEVVDLEAAVPAEHRARVIWGAVERLDLGAFYDEIAARGSAPGRAAIDPKVLLALWLYAISEGVGSARHLARLCERDSVYRWICGGIEPNHHTLSDFRVGHGEKLDELLTQILAALMSRGLVRLRRVAQDGMRVRASAGAKSFRRAGRLKRWLAEARAQVEALRQELEDDPGNLSRREKAARERAAREREQAVERALREMAKVQRIQQRSRRQRPERGELRVSTTDPEARVMKMGDGGYRPAFNVQYATDTQSRIIVGAAVTSDQTDGAQLVPMLDEVEKRSNGLRPKEHLVDGGYAVLQGIDEAEKRGVRVYAPVPEARSDGNDPYERKRDDTDRTAAWRARMKTKSAHAIYKERAATAETINADQRAWRGMHQFRVRGTAKVSCVVLLAALMHNILRAHAVWGL